MKNLAPLLILLFGFPVYAQQTATAQLSWTNATQNTDATLIPSSGHGSLAFTTIEYSQCVNGDIDPNNIQRFYVSANQTSASLSLEGVAGDYCFRGKHTNADGAESALSNLTVKTTTVDGQPRDFTTPTAPTTLTVDDPTVYTVVRQENSFFLLAVGSVPSNTECIPDQVINGHHVVPNSAVTFDGTVKPVVVVAKCS